MNKFSSFCIVSNEVRLSQGRLFSFTCPSCFEKVEAYFSILKGCSIRCSCSNYGISVIHRPFSFLAGYDYRVLLNSEEIGSLQLFRFKIPHYTINDKKYTLSYKSFVAYKEGKQNIDFLEKTNEGITVEGDSHDELIVRIFVLIVMESTWWERL